MAKKGQRSSVKVHIKENRLYIILKGVIQKKTLEEIYTEIRFCVSDLRPGFSVITDLSSCTFGHLSAAPILTKIVSYLQENQVGEIVRVTGEARLIYLQILKLSDRFKGYNPVYLKTLEEAREYLDKEQKKVSAN